MIPFKTFRFLVLINNTTPGIIVEQRSINVTDATRAVQAQYGKDTKVVFYGFGNEGKQ
jgi:hypothetical protein